MFDYVGLFAAAVSLKNNFRLEETANPQNEADPIVAEQLKVMFENSPQLYWIAIGNTDFLYSANETYRNYLDSKGYKYEYVESEGGHIWRKWRTYLATFTQRLFK